METLSERRKLKPLAVQGPEMNEETEKDEQWNLTSTIPSAKDSAPSEEEVSVSQDWNETNVEAVDNPVEDISKEEKKHSDVIQEQKQMLDEAKLRSLMKSFDVEWCRLKSTVSFQTEENSLPSEEPVVEFCSCALEYYYILRQGWLYITPKFLCFTAGILGGWGSRLLRVFAFADVTAVKKRTYLSFDTAIEIEVQGTSYLFATFLKREKTYETLYRYWMNIMAVRAFEDRLPARVRDPQSASSHNDVPNHTESPKSSQASSTIESVKGGENKTHKVSSQMSGKRDALEQEETSHIDEGIPRPQEKGNLIEIGRHIFSVSVEDLFNLVFSDSSKATFDFQKRLGNTDIYISNWKMDPNESHEWKPPKKKTRNMPSCGLQPGITYTRSIRYMKTIWAGLMTWKTKVVETQWCCLTLQERDNVRLDIETTVKTLNNPNSESFFVYQHDQITSTSTGCELKREFSVIFLQKTMFKGVILRETEKQSRAGFELFMDTIRLLLSKNPTTADKREKSTSNNFSQRKARFWKYYVQQGSKDTMESTLASTKEYLLNQRKLLRTIEKELQILEQMMERLQDFE
eukprot:jgi/Galph1/1207/GphlegSOOS_G5948.1